MNTVEKSRLVKTSSLSVRTTLDAVDRICPHPKAVQVGLVMPSLLGNVNLAGQLQPWNPKHS